MIKSMVQRMYLVNGQISETTHDQSIIRRCIVEQNNEDKGVYVVHKHKPKTFVLEIMLQCSKALNLKQQAREKTYKYSEAQT